MGEVVSLRRARKTRDRRADEAQAAANRVAFGRTKAEKATDRAERARHDAAVDGAKLDP